MTPISKLGYQGTENIKLQKNKSDKVSNYLLGEQVNYLLNKLFDITKEYNSLLRNGVNDEKIRIILNKLKSVSEKLHSGDIAIKHPAFVHDLTNDLLIIRSSILSRKEVQNNYLNLLKDVSPDVIYDLEEIYNIASSIAVGLGLELDFLFKSFGSEYPINIDKSGKVLSMHTGAFGKIKKHNNTGSLIKYLKNEIFRLFGNDVIAYDEIRLMKSMRIQGIPVNRIIGNLFKNAKEAGATKVYVTVTKSLTKDILIVSDNGPGMDENIVKEILFKKGVSMKGKNRGIGMYYLGKNFLEETGSELELLSLDENLNVMEVLYSPVFSLGTITEDNIVPGNIEYVKFLDEKEFIKRNNGFIKGTQFIFRKQVRS